jgi:hypothetical protein
MHSYRDQIAELLEGQLTVAMTIPTQARRRRGSRAFLLSLREAQNTKFAYIGFDFFSKREFFDS